MAKRIMQSLNILFNLHMRLMTAVGLVILAILALLVLRGILSPEGAIAIGLFIAFLAVMGLLNAAAQYSRLEKHHRQDTPEDG
jgi:ABC-type transport system involved in cytochrome bd biosynthesis fused ATPase/permease subunit